MKRSLQEIMDELERLRVETCEHCNEAKAPGDLSMVVFHIENALDQIDSAVDLMKSEIKRQSDSERGY